MSNDNYAQEQYERNVLNEGMAFLRPNFIDLFRCEICGNKNVGFSLIGKTFWCVKCFKQLLTIKYDPSVKYDYDQRRRKTRVSPSN